MNIALKNAERRLKWKGRGQSGSAAKWRLSAKASADSEGDLQASDYNLEMCTSTNTGTVIGKLVDKYQVKWVVAHQWPGVYYTTVGKCIAKFA